jgi:glycosyltransferase involved in cell wall biosynthesis
MISFVVPARNDGTTIFQGIPRAFERAVNHIGLFEIIVVDYGSFDDAYEAACSVIASNCGK